LPQTSPTDTTVSRFLLVAIATFVLAIAFGADFGSEEEIGYAEWSKQEQERGKGSWMPWRGGSKKRHRLDDLQETRMRLFDERARRIAAEESLSLARTRLTEAATERQSLEARIRALADQLDGQNHEVTELRAEVARASAASPELVDQFIALADEAVVGARFESALALLDDATAMLDVLEPADLAARVSRLEFIRATAWVALGDEAAAAKSLTRLLEADPEFVVDAATSPKLMRVLDTVRAERSPVAHAQ